MVSAAVEMSSKPIAPASKARVLSRYSGISAEVEVLAQRCGAGVPGLLRAASLRLLCDMPSHGAEDRRVGGLAGLARVVLSLDSGTKADRHRRESMTEHCCL